MQEIEISFGMTEKDSNRVSKKITSKTREHFFISSLSCGSGCQHLMLTVRCIFLARGKNNLMAILLQALSSQEQKKILLDIADALEANQKLITIENEADVAAAQHAGYEKSLISRLALKPGKVKC